MLRRIILSIVISSLCGFAFAQDYQPRYLLFDHLGIDDGLSQGMVNCMIQDKYGFMWFGTKDGLNRYDGFKFVVYRHDPMDSTSIGDNFIQYIYEDEAGRLWIGTANRGVDLFNREAETFTHLRHDAASANSLSDDRVDFITSDQNGDIWVGTQNGLTRIGINAKGEGNTFSFTRYLSGNTRVFRAGDQLFGSVYKQFVYRLNPDSVDITGPQKTDLHLFSDLETAEARHDILIGGVAKDATENKLYLLSHYSISAIDLTTGAEETIWTGNTSINIWGRGICIDATKKIWISTMNGLKQYDVNESRWYEIMPENASLDVMLASTGVTYQDRSGMIWIGTRGYGILKYNPRSEKFKRSGDESISFMKTIPGNKLVVGKQSIVMSVFDPIAKEYPFSLTKNELVKSNPAAKEMEQTAYVTVDENGLFWLVGDRLSSYDTTTSTYKTYPSEGRWNFPVHIDDLGVIWTGNEKHFTSYDPQKNVFANYNYPVEPMRLPYEFLQCIYQDDNNVFWLGTLKGLLRFDAATGKWMQYNFKAGDPASLSLDVIFSICADLRHPNDYLWIGTGGGGLNRFDIHTGKFIHYSIKDGLPNEVIYGILPDDQGYLWLSTNNGLSRFNPETNTFKNFQVKDGLQGNEFNRYSYCKTENGWLFFGGVNGITYFNPADISDQVYSPSVLITDFRIRNKPVSHRDENPVLSQPVYLTKKIVLSYDENMISFEFASMDFTAPESNVYQYMLDGFDEDWVQSVSGHSATYTNLDPGTYTFLVKGSNNDGIWNDMPASIELIILPPWYMTWWFRVLMLLAIGGILYGIYRFRLQQALKMQSVRNRIARDLHDEIGANLSSIRIFSEVANEKSDTSPGELKTWLTKINEYTQTSLDAINDIVWMINARNDRFENIFSRMRALAAELFEARNFHLHISFDETLEELKLGMEERKNFYMIYKEALNNIAKYAECNNVWIDVTWNRPHVKLVIRDDGKGFDMQQIDHGNGLLNMQQRAETLGGNLVIVTSPGQGTRIELTFKL